MKFFQTKGLFFLATPKKPRRKLINGLSIASVYILFIAFIVALMAILVPQISYSISVFAENLPDYLSSLDTWLQQTAHALNAEELIEGGISLSNLFSKAFAYLKTVIPDIANAGIDIATKIVSYASDTILAIVISIYTLLSKDLLISQAKKAIYALFNKRYADNTIALTRESNEIFWGLHFQCVTGSTDYWQPAFPGTHHLPCSLCTADQCHHRHYRYYPLCWAGHRRCHFHVVAVCCFSGLCTDTTDRYHLHSATGSISLHPKYSRIYRPHKILGCCCNLAGWRSVWAPGYHPGHSAVCGSLFGFYGNSSTPA